MQSFALDGVLVDRADAFLKSHPSAEELLRRLLTLKLATVHRDSEPNSRRAPREEFSDEEWRLVTELADYPNWLLVTATTEWRNLRRGRPRDDLPPLEEAQGMDPGRA